MADVKARLKLFEVGSEGSKPEIGAKPGQQKNIPPALQKFLQKKNELAEEDGGPDKSNAQALKPPPGGTKTVPSSLTNKNENQRNGTKPSPASLRKAGTEAKSSSGGSSNGTSDERRLSLTKGHTENRRVSVPKVFQNEPASGSSSDGNKPPPPSKPAVAGARPTAALKPAVLQKKVGLPNANTSTSAIKNNSSSMEHKGGNSSKPPPAPSATKSSVSSTSSNASTLSSQSLNSNSSNSGLPNSLSGGVKLPALATAPALKKTNSVESTTSSSSMSSSATDTNTTSSDTNGPIDFRSNLKRTKNSFMNGTATPLAKAGPNGQKSSSGNSVDSTHSNNADTFPPNSQKPVSAGDSGGSPPTKTDSALSNGHKSLSSGDSDGSTSSKTAKNTTSPSESTDKQPPLPPRGAILGPPKKNDTAGQEQKRRSDSVIIERNADHKKFKKIRLETLPGSATGTPPTKPPLPSKAVDLTLIREQYEKTIQMLEGGADSEGQIPEEELVEDDLYTDGFTEQVLPRRPLSSRDSQRISLIPVMTAEEEGLSGDDDSLLYDEGFTPVSPEEGDVYDEGETEKKDEEFDDEEIYEDEDSLAAAQETEEQKKARLKKEEKERKEREKEEEKKKRKEEKERALKEKEEQKLAKLRKKFGLSDNQPEVGEGVIKQDAKGWPGSNALSVKKGQMVTIVKMDGNPPNKWLVRSDGGMGYVESSNIEVDPNVIRQAMGTQRKDSSSTAKPEEKGPVEEEQAFYDDVASEAKGAEDSIEEEIYEPIE